MTAVTARILSTSMVRGHDDGRGTGPEGAADTVHTFLERWVIGFDHNGTQVAGGTDTLDVNAATAIANGAQPNGKSYTLRHACIEQAAYSDGGAAGSGVAVTGTVSVSGNVVSLTPKSATNG